MRGWPRPAPETRGHLDFLLDLRKDEISRRATVSLAKRLAPGPVRGTSHLEGFDFAASPKLPPRRSATWPRCAGNQVFMNGPSFRPNKIPGRVIPAGKEDIR